MWCATETVAITQTVSSMCLNTNLTVEFVVRPVLDAVAREGEEPDHVENRHGTRAADDERRAGQRGLAAGYVPSSGNVVGIVLREHRPHVLAEHLCGEA